MKFESWQELAVPKIGFGTWKIGGGSYANYSLDSQSLAAIRSALEIGYTHFDTAEGYAAGHAEELLERAIREVGIKRESLFITSKVSPEHLHHDALLKSCQGSLRRLGMDYLDLYLIHWPKMGMKLADAFKALNELVRDGRVRHLGVSNFNLKLLKQSQELSETPLLTDQVPYSLFDRAYAKNGVLDYCRANGILLTAYSPVGQGHLPVNKTLTSIAEKHSTSPHQIAIAWLVSKPSIITIPMSYNPEHQKENFAAADVELIAAEMEQLDHLS
jgi:diketogulonate reductase-like aldo/keto reductase